MKTIILFIWLITGILFPVIAGEDTGIISIVPLVSLFVFPFMLCLVDGIFKTHLSCTIFGWHNGNGEKKHYKAGDVLGVNLTSTCSKCGKEVIQDSQGGWF